MLWTLADDSGDRIELDNAIEAIVDQWQNLDGFNARAKLIHRIIHALWEHSEVASSALRVAFVQLENKVYLEDPRFFTLLRRIASIELDVNLAHRARCWFAHDLRNLPPPS